ncbi:MAG: IS200/IS605 family transposase [Campylobacterota bacterium]|nr:IS200/IS605 family transposase [Campylobacterota bacterium]
MIWCPKYRRKILTGAVEKRLKEIVNEVAAKLSVKIVEMETDQDHILILADIDPQFGVARFIKSAKGRSARILREEFPFLKTKLPTLWTNSYFVTTVGGAPLSIVKQYIESQQTSQRPKEKAKQQRFLDEQTA